MSMPTWIPEPRLTALVLAALAAAACSDLEPVTQGAPPAAQSAAAETGSSPGGEPSASRNGATAGTATGATAGAATGATAGAATGAAAGAPARAAGLEFDLPEGWRPFAPRSAMRAFEAAIPGAGGDGNLTLFHFGLGGGGGVEANLDRWVGQMAEASDPVRESFTNPSVSGVWIDTSGTHKRSTTSSFPPADMPGYRLFGAVLEGQGGPWDLRAVGPAPTLEQQRGAFAALLRSARVAPP